MQYKSRILSMKYWNRKIQKVVFPLLRKTFLMEYILETLQIANSDVTTNKKYVKKQTLIYREKGCQLD